MLELVYPCEEYVASAAAGAQEVEKHPSDYDIGSMKRLVFIKDSIEKYITECEANMKGEGLKSGYVPSTVLWLVENGKFIGIFNLRHCLNETLLKSGGHIAYEIIPSERGKGYAKKGLELILDYANKNLGFSEVLICCHEKNVASYKTMLSFLKKNGGREDVPSIIDGRLERRVWVNT